MEPNECSFSEVKAPVEEQSIVNFEPKKKVLHKSGMKLLDN
jgi:hypothetical protein